MNNFVLTKQLFEKKAFDATVDTTFIELTSSVQINTSPSLPSISEFFDNYQALFYDIPKFGDTNSHQYLIFTSQEYIGSEVSGNEVINSLIAEITDLRQENLELQQELSQQNVSSIQDALQNLQTLNGQNSTNGGGNTGGSSGGGSGGGNSGGSGGGNSGGGGGY